MWCSSTKARCSRCRSISNHSAGRSTRARTGRRDHKCHHRRGAVRRVRDRHAGAPAWTNRRKKCSHSWMDRDGQDNTPAGGALELEPSLLLTGRPPAGGRYRWEGNGDGWIYQWERDDLTRLTVEPQRQTLCRCGPRIVYASCSGRRGRWGDVTDLYWQRADGTGDAQRLTEQQEQSIPGVLAPEWQVPLRSTRVIQQTANDLMILPMEGGRGVGLEASTTDVLLNTTANEIEPMFSKDGRWLAYATKRIRAPASVRAAVPWLGRWAADLAGRRRPFPASSRYEAGAVLFQSAAGREIVGRVGPQPKGTRFAPTRPAPGPTHGPLRGRQATEQSTTQTVNGLRWRPFRRVRSRPNRTRSSSSSTSSTSCGGSRL